MPTSVQWWRPAGPCAWRKCCASHSRLGRARPRLAALEWRTARGVDDAAPRLPSARVNRPQLPCPAREKDPKSGRTPPSGPAHRCVPGRSCPHSRQRVGARHPGRPVHRHVDGRPGDRVPPVLRAARELPALHGLPREECDRYRPLCVLRCSSSSPLGAVPGGRGSRERRVRGCAGRPNVAFRDLAPESPEGSRKRSSAARPRRCSSGCGGGEAAHSTEWGRACSPRRRPGGGRRSRVLGPPVPGRTGRGYAGTALPASGRPRWNRRGPARLCSLHRTPAPRTVLRTGGVAHPARRVSATAGSHSP